MADAIPPAPRPAMADVAPDKLVRFLYFLERDFVPIGVIEHALHRADTDVYKVPDSTSGKLADEHARRLMAD